MRGMANSSSNPPSRANPMPTATESEKYTHRNVRLAFGDMQKNPKFKLRNNF
jgi:hypothetical protein